MAQYCRKIPYSRLALLGLFNTNYDEVLTPGGEELEKKKPTGIAGIRSLYTPNEYGEMGPEFITMTHMIICSAILGAGAGSVLHGKQARIDFMENNQATQFMNHLEAERRLRDTMMLSMGKGGFKWGWRIGSFTAIFICTSTTIAAYKGRSGFSEYALAGTLTGGLFRMHMGLKGMIAGSVVGTILGSIAGAASALLLYITRLNFEDLQKAQYELKTLRDERVRITIAKQFGDTAGAMMEVAAAEERQSRESVTKPSTLARVDDEQ